MVIVLKTLSGIEVMHQLHKKAKANRISLAFSASELLAH
ncbi:hypothetical protein Nizo3893_1318 [Lactiplantibacillus plantarum]|nr:hypothetical protein Nizo3893_1318 [Lactiplantibacillus plantarum]